MSRGSEKADRDSMVSTIFKIVNSKEGAAAKIGSIVLSVAQFFYRRKTRGNSKDEITRSGFGKQISEAIRERFEGKNSEAIRRFNIALDDSTKYMGTLMKQSFKPYLEEEKTNFNNELEVLNMASFESILQKVVDDLYDNKLKEKEGKAEPITAEDQIKMMEETIYKLDEVTAENFEKTKTKYLAKVEATVQREMSGGLVDLQMLNYLHEAYVMPTATSISLESLGQIPMPRNLPVFDLSMLQ